MTAEHILETLRTMAPKTGSTEGELALHDTLHGVPLMAVRAALMLMVATGEFVVVTPRSAAIGTGLTAFPVITEPMSALYKVSE